MLALTLTSNGTHPGGMQRTEGGDAARSDAARRVELVGRGGQCRGEHAAAMYFSHEELLEVAVPYVAEALLAGERVVCVARGSPSATLRARLARRGVDVDATDQGDGGGLRAYAASELFAVRGRFDVDVALRSLRADVRSDVLRAHPLVVRGGRARANPYYAAPRGAERRQG
jgi:hypothetical protein